MSTIPSAAARSEDLPRRGFLTGFGKATLSATAIGLLGGCQTLSTAATAEETSSDIGILNTAINAELEAVAAYQLGAESGLLSKPVLDLALKFQGHHKEHAEALAGAVGSLGGSPSQGLERYDFPVEALKSEADVLAFAAELERGAVSAYLGAVPILPDRQLAKVAASILGDEAMHWAILRNALGQDPVPSAFVS